MRALSLNRVQASFRFRVQGGKIGAIALKPVGLRIITVPPFSRSHLRVLAGYLVPG